MSDNSRPISQAAKTFLRFRAAAIFAVMLAALTLGVGSAFADDSPFGPSVTSDQPDYLAGSTVTLAGAGWKLGFPVHVVVTSTDPGLAWSTSGDATVAGDGTFTYSFVLPEEFSASYAVDATDGV